MLGLVTIHLYRHKRWGNVHIVDLLYVHAQMSKGDVHETGCLK